MNLCKIILCVVIFSFIQHALAIEVAGKKLIVYGKAHISIDNANTDDPAVNSDGLSISSNSSRLGFKGELPAGKLKFIFQYEQEVFIDEGAGDLGSRNTYAGLKGSLGQIIAGHHDTPYKTVASIWGLFGDSVGERRAMLGAGYLSGNQLNERAKNSVMYQFKNKSLKFLLLRAVDPEVSQDGKYDNNNKSVTSVGLFYEIGPVWIAASNEQWKNHSKIANGAALRVAAKYKFSNNFKLGMIYESINSDTVSEWKRDASGVNAIYKITTGIDVRAQYVKVNSIKNIKNSGATKISLGLFHTLDKKAQVYFVYGKTNNDKAAKFQVADGGHGDEIKTVTGGSPSALSLGLIYKF